MSRLLTYREAVRTALREEMVRDEGVFVYGLDVADHKGAFGTTLGLAGEFGSGRCFMTPLSEDAMTGFGLGAAINGLRPVHVHQRVDFLVLALNQLANMLSTCRYVSNEQLRVPITIRAVIGRGWGQACQHSKSLHSIFAHLPGIAVVMPATPADARGLMKAAIRADDPVIVLDHRWLHDVSGEVPETESVVPLGRAEIRRPGNDFTIIAPSWMNIEALLAADILARVHGLDTEVIDPRTITPLDADLLSESVNRTGHCLVADCDWLFCGFSAEVAALVANRCFDRLRAPIERLGFAPIPCPSSRILENRFYPGAEEIIRSIERTLKLEPAELPVREFYSYESRFRGPF